MRTAFIIAGIVSFIIAIIEAIYISKNDIGDISRASYKPYPLLGIVVMIDSFFFVSMYNELQTGTYLGKMSTFYLSFAVLVAVFCIMILLIIFSSLRSGFSGLGLAAINTIIYLLAPIGIAWLFSTIFSEVIRIFGMGAIAVLMLLIGFFLV